MEPGAAAAPARNRLHLTHVEGFRALAALTVYLNHAYAQVFYGEHPVPAPPSVAPFRYSMLAGHLAVSVFIVISGFCLTLPVVASGDRIRGGTKDFFKRRARRILPPYYGAVALCLALIFTIIGKPTGTLWDVPIHVDWQAVLCHLLLIQDFFRTSCINYVFWSIAVEWHIYFLFPALVWATRRFGIVRVAIGALVLGYAVRLGFEGTRVDRANVQYVGLFALGMLAAYVTQSKNPALERIKRAPFALFAGLAAAVTLGMMFVWDVEGGTPRFHLMDLPAGVMAMAVLVHSTSNPSSRLARFLNFRPLVAVGVFSYSVYLVHAPLLQILWQYVFTPLGLGRAEMFAAFLVVGLPAVVGAAYLFFKVCEEPFMRSPTRSDVPAAKAAPAPAI